MPVLKITKDNFDDEVINSDKPVILDFWAEWCGPCKMYSPVIEELSDELADVKVGKINIDEEFELSQKFKVMSIPTTIVMENGEVKNKAVGVQTKAEVLQML